MARRALPLLLLAACGTVVDKSDAYRRTPEQERKYKEAAARGEVLFGMTKDEVRQAMGKPNRTSKTTYAKKPATCWFYEFTDIYFDEEGYVIGWQSLTG